MTQKPPVPESGAPSVDAQRADVNRPLGSPATPESTDPSGSSDWGHAWGHAGEIHARVDETPAAGEPVTAAPAKSPVEAESKPVSLETTGAHAGVLLSSGKSSDTLARPSRQGAGDSAATSAHDDAAKDRAIPAHTGHATHTASSHSRPASSASSVPPSASVPPVPPVPPAGKSGSNRGDGGEPPRTRSPYGGLVILLVVLCVALGAGVWYQRQQSEATGMAVAGRLDALSNDLTAARQEAREALAVAQSQAGKINALETAVREGQAEYRTLEQAWQDFNDTTNDGVLANDIDRLLTIASQQLRLGGSVSNAIVALESAQSRLARADRPRFASLQQAVNGDLDRLRAVPLVDVSAQSARIERLSSLVSRAPLVVPEGASVAAAPADSAPAHSEPPPVARAPVAEGAPWWQHWRAEIASWPARAGSTVAHELGDLIRVQRVDQPQALLMSATQAEQMRATLRQRLQTVQLALLMRQASVWKSELDMVASTLAEHYDPRSADTQAALRLTESLLQTPVAMVLPEIGDSLNAMAAVRAQASPEAERN